VVHRQTNPSNVRGLGPVAEGFDEIASLGISWIEDGIGDYRATGSMVNASSLVTHKKARRSRNSLRNATT